MASFSGANFIKKLGDLNNTQQSIQTLSLWLIHHRKHAKNIVQVWNQQLRKAQSGMKLTFMYLANDVIQNSKKKGNEFVAAFGPTLPKAFGHAAKNADDKTKSSLQRLLTIWKERTVYDKNTLRHVKHALSRANKAKTSPETGGSNSYTATPPTNNNFKSKITDRVLHSLSDEVADVESQDPPSLPLLMKAINDLDNSASSDATVREKIAALPPEVSDLTYLDKISDKLEADSFDATLEDACSLLVQYNARLAQELIDRKSLAVMFRDFIAAQTNEQQTDIQTLEEYKELQKKSGIIREEVRSHVQNLPDLTRLPELAGGLGPLPSAGDLFNI